MELTMDVSYLFKTDLSSDKVTPANGENFTLEELQEMVGGYIELVRVPNKPSMRLVVNEDGRMKGLPLNHMATGIFGSEIVGDALYVPFDLLD